MKSTNNSVDTALVTYKIWKQTNSVSFQNYENYVNCEKLSNTENGQENALPFN